MGAPHDHTQYSEVQVPPCGPEEGGELASGLPSLPPAPSTQLDGDRHR